jgi:hypothetical protein
MRITRFGIDAEPGARTSHWASYQPKCVQNRVRMSTPIGNDGITHGKHASMATPLRGMRDRSSDALDLVALTDSQQDPCESNCGDCHGHPQD